MAPGAMTTASQLRSLVCYEVASEGPLSVRDNLFIDNELYGEMREDLWVRIAEL